jgi:hypothetical protein
MRYRIFKSKCVTISHFCFSVRQMIENEGIKPAPENLKSPQWGKICPMRKQGTDLKADSQRACSRGRLRFIQFTAKNPCQDIPRPNHDPCDYLTN